MSSMAELVFEEVRSLPEAEVKEVLDFVGYLKSRHGSTPGASEEEAADWAEFEKLAGAWSGKFNRDECYDREILR